MNFSRMVLLLMSLTLAALFVGQAFADEQRSVWGKPNSEVTPPDDATFMADGDKASYSGKIRVFVNELTSRWKDKNGIPFSHAMLTLALDQTVFLLDGDSLVWDLTWDGHNYTGYDGISYANITESNIEVVAAVSRSDSYVGYSNPPTGAPFNVHLMDASASATPGNPGSNVVVGNYTHSVFVVDGSTTW